MMSPLSNWGLEQPWFGGRLFASERRWVFPEREHFFITDAHADADAFLASLEATGGVERTGFRRQGLRLTDRGRDAVFVMGGDYFDKGPSNLRLLRALGRLRDTGAEVVLLAGNHDVRTYLGIRCAEDDTPRLAHLFVRMGPKTVPLLAEVYRERVAGRGVVELDDAEVERRLLPPQSWWDDFPPLVRDLVPPKRIDKELKRVREKCTDLRARLAKAGMTLGQAHAALSACRELLIEPDGELSWLYRDMVVSHRAGSFLFAHAGIDDVIAEVLRTSGVAAVNRWFRHLLVHDPFALYNGPLGNVFRTKYRAQDFSFTPAGAHSLASAGIHAIVHGHRTHASGQQISMRHGVAHFECDASLDCNTRLASGLHGIGMAATIIGDGHVRAISSDRETVRVWRAETAEAA